MITIVPPGKRGEIRLRAPIDSPIRVTTASALSRGHKPRYISGSRADDTPTEVEAKSVALAQPHRRGSDLDLDGTALGRFCRSHWAHDDRTLISRYDAGGKYAELVDKDRGVHGLSVRKCSIEIASETVLMTDEERDAYCDLCRIKRENAEAVMIPIAPGRRAVNVVYALAYDDRELSGRDHGVAINALYRLAVHFGWERVGFHAE